MSPPDPPNTLDLLGPAQRGDRQALELLVERYVPRVRRMARIELNGRHRNLLDPEDIADLSLVALTQRLAEFDIPDRERFRGLLRTIVSNRVKDEIQHLQRDKRDARRSVSLQSAADSGESGVGFEPAATQLPPLEQLSREESQQLVDECIAELPAQYRDVIRLRSYAGLPWKDVAERAGRPTEDAAREMFRVAMTRLGVLVMKRTRSNR